MTDRLTNIIVGLQRLGEEARIKGEDIRYSQRQEDTEHLRYLRDLRDMVQRVLTGIIEEERKFTPPEEAAVQLNPNKPIPKFLQEGPRKEAS